MPGTFGSKEPAMARPPFSTPSPNPPMPGGANSGGPNSVAMTPRVSSTQVTRPSREATERRTLVVGRGISVQGMVQDAERLVVEGQMEASMIHATELAVSAGGIFKGEIEVEDAEISGTIDGTVTARGSLIVRSTGVVLGTARCRRLQVEDGGQITGRMEMITEPRARAGESGVLRASPVSAEA
jgi:cytoskeletal protein CcmA (bactofilin family)